MLFLSFEYCHGETLHLFFSILYCLLTFFRIKRNGIQRWSFIVSLVSDIPDASHVEMRTHVVFWQLVFGYRELLLAEFQTALNYGFIGGAGVGKSAVINAIRGLSSKHPLAAGKVGLDR